MKFAFGRVVTSDMWDVRIMLVAPAVANRAGWMSAYPVVGRPGNWWGIVLRDEVPSTATSWEPGDMITLAEDNAGLRIVDTSEGTTE